MDITLHGALGAAFTLLILGVAVFTMACGASYVLFTICTKILDKILIHLRVYQIFIRFLLAHERLMARKRRARQIRRKQTNHHYKPLTK